MNEKLLKLAYSKLKTEKSYDQFKLDMQENEGLRKLAFSKIKTDKSYDEFVVDLSFEPTEEIPKSLAKTDAVVVDATPPADMVSASEGGSLESFVDYGELTKEDTKRKSDLIESGEPFQSKKEKPDEGSSSESPNRITEFNNSVTSDVNTLKSNNLKISKLEGILHDNAKAIKNDPSLNSNKEFIKNYNKNFEEYKVLFNENKSVSQRFGGDFNSYMRQGYDSLKSSIPALKDLNFTTKEGFNKIQSDIDSLNAQIELDQPSGEPNPLTLSSSSLSVSMPYIEGLEKTKSEKYNLENEFKGLILEGAICMHPLSQEGYDFDVPLLHGDFVSTKQGTGFVHVAPGHGEDDFELGMKHNIPVPDVVEGGGTYFSNVPLFAGIHVFKALDPVCDALKKQSSLFASEKYIHSYPHSWRSKKPVIYRATQQWFISMEKNNLKEIALKAIEDTLWVPSISKNRIKSMVKDRPDWCVSRQRVWGVPIPIFLNKNTGDILRDPEVIDRIAKEVEKKGADAWFTEDPQTFLGDKYNSDEYECVQDILDVWFDSGSTHSFVLKSEKQKWPADLYLEGTDQHRGWFQSSLLESCGTRGRAPFDAVLTHGFVLDGQGRKMSKSIGNVISPQEIMKQSGADILRLWVAMTDITEDVRISPEVLKGVSESYRRLRNTIRFTIGALNDYEQSESISMDIMPELEKWVLHRLKELDILLKKAVDSYTFQAFYSELNTFCSSDLSAFYFDIRKDSLYCDNANNEVRRSARTVLYEVFKCLTAWLAPVICYTAEEAWLAYNGNENEDSIHLKQFPEIPENWINDELNDKWLRIRKIRKFINGGLELARQEKIIGSSLEAKIVICMEDTQYSTLLEAIDIEEISIVSKVEVIKGSILEGSYKEDGLEGLGVLVSPALGKKCVRCWKIDEEIDNNLENPLCNRCIEVVK